MEDVLKKYGKIESIEVIKGTGAPYTAKSIVTYKQREEAVSALIDLENHRYIGKAAVPMSVKLLNETQPSTLSSAESAKGPQKTSHEEKKETAAQHAKEVKPPAMYIEYFTPQGNPYYYNTATGKTQWETPPVNAVVTKPNLEPKNIPGHFHTLAASTRNITMPKFSVVLVLALP